MDDSSYWLKFPPKKNKINIFFQNSSGAVVQQGSSMFEYKTHSWIKDTNRARKAFKNAPAHPDSVVYKGVHKIGDPANRSGPFRPVSVKT